jgi:hypothetical protein
MSGHKTRVRTIQALLAGCHSIALSPAYPIIHSEFQEVHAVRRIRRDFRRRLLEVLHSARGLDTVLKTVVVTNGCTSGTKRLTGMGSYLYALRDHSVSGLGRITEANRLIYQNNIVKKRNTYLHEAGAFPVTDTEVNILLSEMHACISTVVAL